MQRSDAKPSSSKAAKKRSREDQQGARARTARKAPEERLTTLVEKGKKAGKLTAKELMDVLEDMNLDPEELDKFYDTLEATLDVDISGDDVLPAGRRCLPDLEELRRRSKKSPRRR